MRILVTGAAGFIGSQLAERLVSEGNQVRGIDSLTDYYDPARKRRNLSTLAESPEFELIEASINESDPAQLLDGVEVVFHLAGQPGVRASWGGEFSVYLEDNVKATQRLLEAAKGADLQRFVLASSSSIYGDAEHYPTSEEELPRPVSPYGVTKLAAEHLGRLYWRGFGVPTVGLRYFTIFGPRQRPDMAFTRFIEAGLEDRPVQIYGDGKQMRDFTFVDDCIAATIAAGSKGEPGGVYNIAGGTEATVLDVLEILGGLLGREIQRDHLEAMVGDARRTGADTTRARRDLGYEPQTSLESGLEKQLDVART
jgi:nucleoside-diphosphate-sugar epimerase